MRTWPWETAAAVSMPIRTRVLAGFVVLAVLFRALWASQFGWVIENEGAEYAQLARSLLAGNGYVGVSGGRHALFPPLYPLAIAALSQVLGSLEWAARSISLVAGIAALWPLFLLGRHLGGELGGVAAVALAGVHGLFIALSGSAYSEMFYFCIIAWGLWFSVNAIEGNRYRDLVLAGIAFGLAYLVRPEALAYPLILAFFLAGTAIARRTSPRRLSGMVAGTLLIPALLMTPYAAWLSVNSGYVRIEGKTLSNGIIAERMTTGMSYGQAARGLGPDMELEGPYLEPDQFDVKREFHSGAGGIVSTILRDIDRRVMEVARDMLRDRSLGWIGMYVLAVVGALGSLASTVCRPGKLFLLAAGGSYLAMLFTMEHRWDRHLYPVAFFCLPWAAAGASFLWYGMASWLADRRIHPVWKWTALPAYLVAAGAIVAVPSVSGALQTGTFSQSRDVQLRSAGEWIRGLASRENGVVTMSGTLAYYAESPLVYPPWTDSGLALRYLRQRQPGFLVMRASETRHTPYFGDWLRYGVPAGCATLLRSFPGGEDPIHVYEWTCK